MSQLKIRGVGRIAPYYTHQKLIDEHGQTKDIFRKWFQSFADIANDYFVIVRRSRSGGGSRANQPLSLFQNSPITTTERDDIEASDRVPGMQIYNETTSKLQVWTGAAWENLN